MKLIIVVLIIFSNAETLEDYLIIKKGVYERLARDSHENNPKYYLCTRGPTGEIGMPGQYSEYSNYPGNADYRFYEHYQPEVDLKEYTTCNHKDAIITIIRMLSYNIQPINNTWRQYLQ